MERGIYELEKQAMTNKHNPSVVVTANPLQGGEDALQTQLEHSWQSRILIAPEVSNMIIGGARVIFIECGLSRNLLVIRSFCDS
jgi:hypothetical protein